MLKHSRTYGLGLLFLLLAVVATPLAALPAQCFTTGATAWVDVQSDEEGEEIPQLTEKVTHCQWVKLTPRALWTVALPPVLPAVLLPKGQTQKSPRRPRGPSFVFSCSSHFRALFRCFISPNAPPYGF